MPHQHNQHSNHANTSANALYRILLAFIIMSRMAGTLANDAEANRTGAYNLTMGIDLLPLGNNETKNLEDQYTTAYYKYEFETANKIIDALLEQYPDNEEYISDKIKIALKRDNFEDYIKWSHKLYEINPNNPSGLAYMLINSSNRSDAAQRLPLVLKYGKELSKYNLTDPEEFYARSIYYTEVGKAEKSLEALENAISNLDKAYQLDKRELYKNHHQSLSSYHKQLTDPQFDVSKSNFNVWLPQQTVTKITEHKPKVFKIIDEIKAARKAGDLLLLDRTIEILDMPENTFVTTALIYNDNNECHIYRATLEGKSKLKLVKLKDKKSFTSEFLSQHVIEIITQKQKLKLRYYESFGAWVSAIVAAFLFFTMFLNRRNFFARQQSPRAEAQLPESIDYTSDWVKQLNKSTQFLRNADWQINDGSISLDISCLKSVLKPNDFGYGYVYKDFKAVTIDYEKSKELFVSTCIRYFKRENISIAGNPETLTVKVNSKQKPEANSLQNLFAELLKKIIKNSPELIKVKNQKNLEKEKNELNELEASLKKEISRYEAEYNRIDLFIIEENKIKYSKLEKIISHTKVAKENLAKLYNNLKPDLSFLNDGSISFADKKIKVSKIKVALKETLDSLLTSENKLKKALQGNQEMGGLLEKTGVFKGKKNENAKQEGSKLNLKKSDRRFLR